MGSYNAARIEVFRVTKTLGEVTCVVTRVVYWYATNILEDLAASIFSSSRK
jgi:hypothetical protein